MSLSQSFFNYNYNHTNHEEADDSSTVFDADTVVPDEVPSLPPAPAIPILLTANTSIENHHQQPNNYESISSISIQEESSATCISELLHRINSRRSVAVPSTITTATATTAASSPAATITNKSSSHHSMKQPPTNEEAISTNQSSPSQTSTTIKLTKYQLRWIGKFKELRAYKHKYGNANVTVQTKGYRQLGIWVCTQRHNYKKLKKNGKANMSKERIDMLESIGFKWVGPRTHSSAWNTRFAELLEFKNKYGHSNVPNRCTENRQLGTWVATQRNNYNKLKDNKKANMSKERIEMLESIGFEWVKY